MSGFPSPAMEEILHDLFALVYNDRCYGARPHVSRTSYQKILIFQTPLSPLWQIAANACHAPAITDLSY